MSKKIQKKAKLSSAGRGEKKACSCCAKPREAAAKIRVTSYELFYDTPREDEDILATIRKTHLEVRGAL